MAEEESRIEVGDRVLVTGAGGFIGSAVTRALLERGARVVALLEPQASQANLAGLEVERVVSDINDADGLRRAATGVRFVFHLAAIYRFWPAEPSDIYKVNVEGTRSVLSAARAAGSERVVYTSSVATLGHRGTEPVDETSYPHIEALVGNYERSKYIAEHEALRAAAAGLPVVLVLPTTPFGPGDSAPTPTGRIVLDFLNGHMIGWVDTALNVVDVADVALGHLLAAERGAIGHSYILGGENLELRQIFELLSACTGLPAPKMKVPRWVPLPVAYLSEVLEGRLFARDPSVTVAAARIATSRRVFSDERARRELGYKSRPAAEALERSARWYTLHEYVSPARAAKIRWT